jgi:hypothetical protein
LIACELEPGSARALGTALRGDRRCKALTIDGWTAVAAFLIDPPFEEAADFHHLSDVLSVADRKWPTGVYVLWYIPMPWPGGFGSCRFPISCVLMPALCRLLSPRGAPLSARNVRLERERRIDHHQARPDQTGLGPETAGRTDWLAP